MDFYAINPTVEKFAGNFPSEYLGFRVCIEDDLSTEEAWNAHEGWLLEGNSDYVAKPDWAPSFAEMTAKAVEVKVELLWDQLRVKRDRLIAETDWWASSDRTMTAEQTAYRQALRDLPANTTDPANPVWPTKPE